MSNRLHTNAWTTPKTRAFNGSIAEVVAQTRFACAAELEQTLTDDVRAYHHHIPQRNLGHRSPVEALFSEIFDAHETQARHMLGMPTHIPTPRSHPCAGHSRTHQSEHR